MQISHPGNRVRLWTPLACVMVKKTKNDIISPNLNVFLNYEPCCIWEPPICNMVHSSKNTFNEYLITYAGNNSDVLKCHFVTTNLTVPLED